MGIVVAMGAAVETQVLVGVSSEGTSVVASQNAMQAKVVAGVCRQGTSPGESGTANICV